jgi:hypothetical protein
VALLAPDSTTKCHGCRQSPGQTDSQGRDAGTEAAKLQLSQQQPDVCVCLLLGTLLPDTMMMQL